MKYLFCVFLYLTLLTNIQSQNISGIITDSENRPLPYTNISLLHKRIGTASDSLGYFTFNLDKHLNDTLFVSQLGYQSKKIPVQNLINKSPVTIELIESETLLEEVYITNKKKKYTNSRPLGIKRNKIKFKSSVPYGYERCLYIENIGANKGKVAWVSFKLKKKDVKEGYDMFPTYFRIKFYEFNKTQNLPGKLLSSFDSIIKPKNKNYDVIIDVGDKFIPFLESGICIGIEAINPNPNNPSKSMYVTSPNLVMTYDDDPLTWSSYRGQPWTHMTHKMKWKAFGKVSYYYMNPMIEIGVQYEK